MVKHFYVIKDEIVGFMEPVLEVNSDIAIRNFKKSMFKLLTEEELCSVPIDDFNLYEIGTFNLNSGEITSCEPKLVYTGVRCIRDFDNYMAKRKNMVMDKKEDMPNEIS